MRRGISVYDEAGLKTIVDDADIRVAYDARGQRVLLDQEDVTDQLRTPELSMGASAVSAHPCVREKLASLQREVGRNYDVVMDGRDITTNVLPHTKHKFFVTATRRCALSAVCASCGRAAMRAKHTSMFWRN
jgi:cytidylate kinase